MIKKLFIGLAILLFSTCAAAQGSGTPRTLRVKIDANGYLLAAGLAQTNPVTSSLFGNARLKTDSNGNLLVVITGGTISSALTITINGIATTSTDALVLQNTTAALVGTQVQYSPRLRFCGTAWKTDVTTGSQIDCWLIENRPVAAAGATTEKLVFGASINGGAYSDVLTLTNAGVLGFPIATGASVGPFNTTGTQLTGADGGAYFYVTNGAVNINSASLQFKNAGTSKFGFSAATVTDGQAVFTNGGGTTGVGWDVATDNIFKIQSTAFADTATLQVNNLKPTLPIITAGTDDTTTNTGDVTRVRYQATITPASGGAGNCATQAAGFKAAAVTADCVIATLPAGVKLIAAYADVTAGFTCSGTCTGTKVFQAGISAAGVEIFAAARNVAITATYGLADADMGSGLTRAAAIQGGYLNSWSATTTITARFTSGTGNWGNASATFVNAGSIKFTLITELEK